jgi:6,7-dimethyl-8-ribityllumazine synthase
MLTAADAMLTVADAMLTAADASLLTAADALLRGHRGRLPDGWGDCLNQVASWQPISLLLSTGYALVMKSSAPSADSGSSFHGQPDPTWRFAILASTYHSEITSRLAAGTRQRLLAVGVEGNQIEDLPVPGAWELPLATSWAARSGKFSAIIALGVVIKGETSHDQHINRFVSLSLGQLGIEHQMPIAFGLLTCETVSQALQRAGGKFGNKGMEAADAALAMLDLKRKI